MAVKDKMFVFQGDMTRTVVFVQAFAPLSAKETHCIARSSRMLKLVALNPNYVNQKPEITTVIYVPHSNAPFFVSKQNFSALDPCLK